MIPRMFKKGHQRQPARQRRRKTRRINTIGGGYCKLTLNVEQKQNKQNTNNTKQDVPVSLELLSNAMKHRTDTKLPTI